MFASLHRAAPLPHPRILQVAGEPRGLRVSSPDGGRVPPPTAVHADSSVPPSPCGAALLVVEWTGPARDQHRVGLA